MNSSHQCFLLHFFYDNVHAFYVFIHSEKRLPIPPFYHHLREICVDFRFARQVLLVPVHFVLLISMVAVSRARKISIHASIYIFKISQKLLDVMVTKFIIFIQVHMT